MVLRELPDEHIAVGPMPAGTINILNLPIKEHHDCKHSNTSKKIPQGACMYSVLFLCLRIQMDGPAQYVHIAQFLDMMAIVPSESMSLTNGGHHLRQGFGGTSRGPPTCPAAKFGVQGTVFSCLPAEFANSLSSNTTSARTIYLQFTCSDFLVVRARKSRGAAVESILNRRLFSGCSNK